jgi:hypothetical protein
VLFEGDIERFLVALKVLHQGLKREDGVLE